MWWVWRLLVFLTSSLLLLLVLTFLAGLRGKKCKTVVHKGKEFTPKIRVSADQIAPVILIVSLLMVAYIDHRPLSSFGLHFYSSWWREMGLGIAIGCIMWILTATIFWGLSKKNPFKKPSSKDLASIRSHFIGGGLMEELSMRGYLFQTLIGGIGLWPAVAVTSGVFGLLHYQSQKLLGVLETGAAGFMLALTIVQTNALWLAIGLHFSWNFFEAAICKKDMQPAYLRSLAAIIVILLFLVLLVLLPLQPYPEMERLWTEYIQLP